MTETSVQPTYPSADEAYEQVQRALLSRLKNPWAEVAPMAYATYVRVKRLDILGTEQHRAEFTYQYQVNLELAKRGHLFSVNDLPKGIAQCNTRKVIGNQFLQGIKQSLGG